MRLRSERHRRDRHAPVHDRRHPAVVEQVGDPELRELAHQLRVRGAELDVLVPGELGVDAQVGAAAHRRRQRRRVTRDPASVGVKLEQADAGTLPRIAHRHGAYRASSMRGIMGSLRFRPRRHGDLTGGAAGTAEPAVQRHQWAVERLCQRHVPRVVAGQVAAQSPTHARHRARRERAPGRAAGGRGARWSPPAARVPRPARTGAGRCSPRPAPTPARRERPRRGRTAPIHPRSGHQPGIRPAPTNPRRWSRPVRVTSAQDCGRRNMGARRFHAIADLLEPRFD